MKMFYYWGISIFTMAIILLFIPEQIDIEKEIDLLKFISICFISLNLIMIGKGEK